MKRFLLLFVAALSTCASFSQKQTGASTALEAQGKSRFEERIFLHVNATFFLTGESILFKAYCMKADGNTASDLSKIAYVELIGPGADPVLQAKIQLKNGSGFGDFFLPSSLPSGNYTLIAYTRWMRNYSPSAFFRSQITVINPFKKPATADATSNQKADVKFYPEGGTLVAGVKNEIGFRGMRAGNYLKFSGKVLDENGQTVAEFNSSQNGTGKFALTPTLGHEYKAVVSDSLQNVTFVPLPKASASGIAMEMKNTTAGFQFILTSKATGKETMKLLVHKGSTTIYESDLHFVDGSAEVNLPLATIPGGISRVSILNSSNGVECTRLIWKVPESDDKLNFGSQKSNFSLREKVDLTLNMKDTSRFSDISVSVRKIEPELIKATDIRTFAFGNTSLKTTNDELISAGDQLQYSFNGVTGGNNKSFIPEVRGNLITGLVEANGKPSQNQTVYLSAPAKEYQFYASKTDSAGRFFFNTDRIPSSSNLVFTVNNKSCPDCKVTMDRGALDDYSIFKVPQLHIDSTFKKLIERRSVLSQIENAYYVQKQDSITGHSGERFYGKPDKSYRLDDYVRFPTMEDVFIEYITEIITRKSGDQHEIRAMNFVTRQAFTEEPLVLLDGVPLFDVEQIMNYNPLILEKIEVVGRRYFYGPLDVQGIISLSTYNGDVPNISLPEKFTFTGVQPRKKYYSPDYRTRALDKIPDYRIQLYWNPEVTVSSKETKLSFFTSDIPGEYEIVAEGMQSDGTPIYERRVIRVGN